MTDLLAALLQGSPPGLLLVLAAIPVALLPQRLSQPAMLALPVLGLWQLFQMPAEFSQTLPVFGYTLEITRIDALSRVFGIVFHIAAFIGVNDGKVALAVGVTDDLVGAHSAVELVRAGSAAVGGKGGGGRPDFAQAGGPDGDKAAEGLEAIKSALAG